MKMYSITVPWRMPLLCLLLLIGLESTARAGGSREVQWSELPSLPPAPGETVQPGLAGAFAGAQGEVIIVAGGANFPEAPPWEGGAKVWHDQVYVLRPGAEGEPEWVVDPENRLPRPLAYGVAVGTPEGLLCVGGGDAERAYADAFLLRWNAEAGSVEIEELPPLPRPLVNMAGAVAGGRFYVAGGQEAMAGGVPTRNFWSVPLTPGNPETMQWSEHEPWSGAPRVLPVAVGQFDGQRECFYVFGGRNPSPGGLSERLSDAWKYDPLEGEWQSLGAIQPPGGEPRVVTAGSAIALGSATVLVFGGDDMRIFNEIERAVLDSKQATAEAEKEAASARLNLLLSDHPGFSREVLCFNAITNAWSRHGAMPDVAPVTTSAFRVGDRIVLASGETRPGVRTPELISGELKTPSHFTALDFTVLGIYLALLVAMGFYFARRENSVDDFFKAGGRVPWWAAGISIFGTQLSAITFMAIPAKTYASDWRYFMLNMSIIIAAPFIVFIFLPFYRRLGVTTAYEYLERRFNLAARLLGSLMFIMLQIGRIGIVLFLPSIALSVVTGIDVRVCILVMGVLSIAYTVLGGIEAVVWTDVLQVVILLGGALLSLLLMVLNVDGSLGEIITPALEAGKFHTFDFTFSLREPTFWVVLLGGLSIMVVTYGTDQAVIQRYLTTKDEASAARGIWTNAVITLPASVLFFFLGTALWLFFRSHPAEMMPGLEPSDALLPWFIVSQMPAGISGLLIAAIFAASMSSLDSSMNSISAAVTTDFYSHLGGGGDQHAQLRFARWVTLVAGAGGTLLAFFMAEWGIRSLWDQLNAFIGLFTGGLGGLFLLGMLTRRANGTGALAGLAVSAVVQYWMKQSGAVHVLMFTFTGLVSCLVVGYLVSLLTPGTGHHQGLTVYSMARVNQSETKESQHA